RVKEPRCSAFGDLRIARGFSYPDAALRHDGVYTSARLGFKFYGRQRATIGCPSCSKHVHTLTDRNCIDVCRNDVTDFTKSRPLAEVGPHPCKSRRQNRRPLPFSAPPDVCRLYAYSHWLSDRLSLVAEFFALLRNLFS